VLQQPYSWCMVLPSISYHMALSTAFTPDSRTVTTPIRTTAAITIFIALPWSYYYTNPFSPPQWSVADVQHVHVKDTSTDATIWMGLFDLSLNVKQFPEGTDEGVVRR